MSTKRKQEDDSEQASSIAVKHIINPPDLNLVEVSNISVGQAHPLVMLQAYEAEVMMMVVQIREMQAYRLGQKYDRLYNKPIGSKDYPEGFNWRKDFGEEDDWDTNEETGEITYKGYVGQFKAEMDEIAKTDSLEFKNLFINNFRHALYQVSRGKEGFLLDKVTILADTDMQTRSSDPSSLFKNSMRSQ